MQTYTLKPGKEHFHAVSDFFDHYDVERKELIQSVVDSLNEFVDEDDIGPPELSKLTSKNEFKLINWNNSDGLPMQIEIYNKKISFLFNFMMGSHVE